MPLKEGEIILGRYRIMRQLGHGGMAITYLASEMDDGEGQPRDEGRDPPRYVVIKTTSAESLSKSEIELLKREARLMEQTRHESLPRIYLSDFQDKPYIVMEYVPGETLYDRLRRYDHGVPLDDALRWLLQLLDALEHLHELKPPTAPKGMKPRIKGIIHRDVHPRNVIIMPPQPPRQEDLAVLIDFGIARRLDRQNTSTLVEGALHRDYAPVEQYLADSLKYHLPKAFTFLNKLTEDGIGTGPYSDIYSLAASFYHALTGVLPPQSVTRLEMDVDPLKSPHDLRLEIPSWLSNILLKAMALHPRDRFKSAAEMRATLFLGGEDGDETDSWSLPEVVPISAGDFRMGSDEPEAHETGAQPEHGVLLGAYAIGRCLVTNREYQRFIDADPKRAVPYSTDPLAAPYCWDREARRYPQDAGDLPVVLVNWQDAVDYCAWLARITNLPYRLPTEAEWEKAARWDATAAASRIYPWGPLFRSDYCAAGTGKAAPVDQFSPQGNSAFGVAQMVGNVWQWTSSGFWRYPYLPDARENPEVNKLAVVRGGAFDETDRKTLVTTCFWRGRRPKVTRYHNVGFRVARDIPDVKSVTTDPTPRKDSPRRRL